MDPKDIADLPDAAQEPWNRYRAATIVWLEAPSSARGADMVSAYESFCHALLPAAAAEELLASVLPVMRRTIAAVLGERAAA